MPPRRSTRGALAAAAAMLLVLAVLGYAKFKLSGPPAPFVPHYPDGPDGLKALFSDVLKAAQDDDRDRVHDLLASMVMSDADLSALFGPRAAALRPRYHAMIEDLVNEGAVGLAVKVYERKLDTVEVIPVDPHAPDASESDRALGRALVAPLRFYSVRLRRATEKKGLRYDFFFYRNGRWLTGNQLGKAIAVAEFGGDGGTRP